MPPEPELGSFEASAESALERLWMAHERLRALGDEVEEAEARQKPSFRPEHCAMAVGKTSMAPGAHLHPLFHALCLYFAGPRAFSEGPFGSSRKR